ncbi:putative TCP-1/cpn60 family chaperonin [Neospora caninum Liverpool]|uniref:CCT-beta n=1 Tax=Neospora caninum (strain Liverpool) TaxID=572307 RepID=F0VEA6_NEOCL|nr:putative TCP-1/cpn60 family chaperonin [Neospora caninum Liverpool]CBZ52050.1 putative TCP-1/cpn60 family chaperonin [Neospora caninum Liverpool]CEL66011.1 TPA: TCP-1/cpn60 family chaperonin, putative [Neospora caninum Liverpool]|eukprot:XP_003882082.1 putative TCP-1/cpn60 family chaperonin [Neospora caninum Liverpool]
MKVAEGGVPEVLQRGAQQDKGETARLQYFVGAIAVGELVKSTLGPKGLDKILTPMQAVDGSRNGKTIITNDGATILKSVWLDNPAAKILADVALQQDAVCGDGTTGVVVLASELLKQAEELVNQNIHPQIITTGYRKALSVARQRLQQISFGCEEDRLRDYLMNVARTTLSSKLLTHEKEHFAKIAVDAILRLKEHASSLELVHIIKKPGGCLRDSFLDEGFILEKRIGTYHPKVQEDCRVMVANTPMDTDKIKIYGARVSVDSFEAVQALELAEKEKMKQKVDKIAAYGCNVFINRQLIYNYPEQIFQDHKVIAIEHADFDGMERLAAALGAEIISTFDAPDPSKLGYCKKLEEIMIGEDKVIRFSGCKRGEACTIVLRGGSEHGLEEAERSLHDALAILSQLVLEQKGEKQSGLDTSAFLKVDGKTGSAAPFPDPTGAQPLVVCGGGAAELAMASAVEELARTEEGKVSLAIEAFAKALRQIPTIILENGGLDSADIVSRLRVAHLRGEHTMGVDMDTGSVADMKTKGVLEAYKSKLSQICFAAEAAEMIVRVDDIIRCAPRERSGM